MSGLASVFPPPPPYFRKFTEQNKSKVNDLKSRGEVVPEELSELIPPSPPSIDQKSYRNFGQIWNVEEHLPSLSESGIEQVYKEGCGESTATLIPELKRLLHSVLIGYLGLVQTLSNDPTQFVGRVDNLRTLFINMHHLLNTYRPLQSKESLILMMEDQIKSVRESAEQMRQSNRAIGDQINVLAARIPSMNDFGGGTADNFEEWEGYDLDADLRVSNDVDEDAMID